jgi:hypothetical protein|tara:strand:- start:11852 stop:11977 length:126 start_codon:yes stop_codon:yes gene_type:complete
MDTKKLVALVGNVLVVTAGVLVAFRVQEMLAQRSVSEPTAE